MSLRATAIGGLRLTTASYGIVAIVNFGKTIVLARILAPADFGLAAIVMAVLALMQTFGDAGIGAAIVQRADITAEQLTSLFWISIAVAVGMAGVYVLCIPAVARFYGHSDLRPLLYMSAAIPVIWAPGLQYQMLLQRNMRFGVLAGIDVAAGVMNAAASSVAAVAGLGAASIILGQVVSAVIRTIGCATFGAALFRPSLKCRMSDAKGFVSFGLFQLADRFVRSLATRIDQILIGKVLGATDLGYYNLAYNLVVQPLTRLAPILGRVMFPVYARMQHDIPRLKRAYFEVLQTLSLLLFPIMLFLAFFARRTVALLYGPRWVPAASSLSILAIAAVFWTIDYPVGTLQVAVGQVRRSFIWSVVILALVAAAVLIGWHRGLTGVASAILTAWAVLYVLEYLGIVVPILGSDNWQYFVGSLILPLGLSVVSGIIARLIVDASRSLVTPSDLLVGIVSFSAVYLALVMWAMRERAAKLLSALTGTLIPTQA